MLAEIVQNNQLQVAFIAYHAWWPSPADPYYQANIDDNTDRVNYYGADYTPHVFLDGTDGGSGGPWEQMALDRAAVDSPLRIVLSADPGAGTITADITNTSASPVTGTLHFAIVETELTLGANEWEYALRDLLPDATGETITYMPSVTVSRTQSYTIDPGWVEENLESIVFVQNSTTREVYQAAKMFFLLDQPGLVAEAPAVDDVAGGNGNGRLDPGETGDLAVMLTNFNPVAATGVSGLLSSSDLYLSIVDGSASWPDMSQGVSSANTADALSVTVDAGTPWGYEIPITLDLSADGGYAKSVDFLIPVGSPEHPIGVDGFGYYAYEEVDDYIPSPVYDWIEIDPNLGGAGTIVTLGDDQAVQRTLPFTASHYGVENTKIMICSNGFLAFGTNFQNSVVNGEIPGPEGPPNMIAGFWTDLNPVAAGGGKVYEYADLANGRYIVEFSGVEHYHDSSLGPPETFQFILYDRDLYPTLSGDTQIDIQYKTVSEPSVCTIGIENNTESIGIQYVANDRLSAAAHGLVDGRAIRFTTTPPDGIVAVENPLGAQPLSLNASPNPFRGGTSISFRLPRSGPTVLEVFRADGSLVRTLVEGEMQAGTGSVLWDGRDGHGRELPAGIYLYRLRGEDVQLSGKVVRVR